MHIRFHHTHAYRGCPATLTGDATPATGDAIAEFSDGSVAAASYRRIDDGQIILHVAPYTTTRRHGEHAFPPKHGNSHAGSTAHRGRSPPNWINKSAEKCGATASALGGRSWTRYVRPTAIQL